MGEWISVADRLPNDNGRYLVMTNFAYEDRIVEILSFAEDLTSIDKYDFPDCHRAGWYGYNAEYDIFEENDTVTHWMPLPEPPET